MNWVFPGGSASEESTCSAGDLDLIPGPGRSLGEGNGYPLQYSCLDISTDRGAWQATAHGSGKESEMTERITLFFHLLYNASGYHQSSYPIFLPSFKLRYNLHTIEFILFFFWPHCAAYGILVPQLGIEPVPPALGTWVLTTGPPGKSHGEPAF